MSAGSDRRRRLVWLAILIGGLASGWLLPPAIRQYRADQALSLAEELLPSQSLAPYFGQGALSLDPPYWADVLCVVPLRRDDAVVGFLGFSNQGGMLRWTHYATPTQSWRAVER